MTWTIRGKCPSSCLNSPAIGTAPSMTEKRALAGRDQRTAELLHGPTAQIGTSGTTREDRESKLRDQKVNRHKLSNCGKEKSMDLGARRGYAPTPAPPTHSPGSRVGKTTGSVMNYCLPTAQSLAYSKQVLTYLYSNMLFHLIFMATLRTLSILSPFSRSGERRLKGVSGCPRSTASWDSDPGLRDSKSTLLTTRLHCSAASASSPAKRWMRRAPAGC